MCVILVALKNNHHYPFIVAANRDEYYARPTSVADYWSDQPDTLAGRDQLAGGTWLGLSRCGRFATVTNHYGCDKRDPKLQSRGQLVSGFLTSGDSVEDFSRQLMRTGDNYNGYGLIFGDFSRLRYQSNQGGDIVDMTQGVHGLSNHFLNSPWPRVEAGKRKLLEMSAAHERLTADQLFEILSDRSTNSEDLPELDGSQSLHPSKMPLFIRSDKFGTRCSTVVMVDRHGTVRFEERTFDPSTQQVQSTRRFEFAVR